jgi:predicted MFS family arabinose efflux permease
MLTPALRRQAIVIVATLATAYVASHFFRAANATIGLDLMRDIGIGPEALGALTGAFFFGFSAMQIPCGILFDRYGPRRTVFAMLLIAIAGGTVFTLAQDPTTLLVGRALMGAGFGVMLIGSMVVISRWFPPDRFATLFSMVLVIFTALAAVAVWLIVRDAPPGHPFLARQRESIASVAAGLGDVFRNPQLPFIMALNFCNYACTFTIQGLWGGPYLQEVHGLSKTGFGNVLLAAVVAYMIGQLVIGPLDRVFDTRKKIAIAGTLVIAAMIATLALVPSPPLWLAIAVIVGIGLISPSSTMVLAHGRATFADRLVGRGIATLNTSVMLGVACMQSVSGFIIGAFERL